MSENCGAYFQTYYATVIAVTSIGSVNVSSDGITVVQENMTLTGITIYDGINCTSEGNIYR